MNENATLAANTFVCECLQSALTKLAKNKKIYSITVSELCKCAGVSRMSFYRNYSSIDDIIEKQLSNIFMEYADSETEASLNSNYGIKEHIEHYFESLFRHREFLDMLIACDLDLRFLKKQNEYLVSNCRDGSDKYKMTAFAGSVFNMFRLWSESGYTIDRDLLILTILEIYQV